MSHRQLSDVPPTERGQSWLDWLFSIQPRYVPESWKQAPSLNEKAVSTPRDNYGMKGIAGSGRRKKSA